MSSAMPLTVELSKCLDPHMVGGKAVNLGALIRAGFPVPGGFVVTTAAYRMAHNDSRPPSPSPLPAGESKEAILSAYRAMGCPPVAVRSSATAEDLAGASMAGQYETFLDIVGEEELIAAIGRCWQSLDSDRTRAYLAEYNIDLESVAMAVVVQKLVPADVAGVMFTANPNTGSRQELLIEASWGLGEAIVSGAVQPDVLRVDRNTGRVLEKRVGQKRKLIAPGGREIDTPPQKRGVLCLDDADIEKLWKMGLKAAEHFGGPQDIEWAIHAGNLYLLQSRPITTLEDAAVYERVLETTRRELSRMLEAGRGPWVLHNLAETLSHPTPLTWSVIERFMSGAGGFGAMYRMAGFEPSAKVCAEGFLLRIAGKVYMDLSMTAEMFFEGYPFRYDLDAIRSDPNAAQQPPTIPVGGIREQICAGRRIAAANRRLREVARELDVQLRERIIPEFVRWCEQEKVRDLSLLSNGELAEAWQARVRRVMDEFAPWSLLPSLVTGMALADLRAVLDENCWDEDPDELVDLLSGGAAVDKTVLANARLREVGLGRRSLDDWLAEFGHRAPEEFDLATPRWRQQRELAADMARRLADGPDPLEMHERRRQQGLRKRRELGQVREIDRKVEMVHRYLPFREDGKYYLMLGYDLLRNVALEAGRRLGLGEDVFHLTAAEMLATLEQGRCAEAEPALERRKREYQAEARIELPRVIDPAAVETLGQPPNVEGGDSHAGLPVSTGSATGPVRVVRSVSEAGELGKGYILVCPSTDPGWTPLFVNAAGLVIECGGMLSHGAVVAREMNIPAIVLPGATGMFVEGEMVRVDGRHGVVSRGAAVDGANGQDGETAPDDARIPRRMIPPVPGARERLGRRIRNWAALIWGVCLVGVYLLPETWVYRPSMRLLDQVFWPLVRSLGKPGAVAAISAGLAVLTMVGQLLLTDNRRLREAKRRANLLSRQADALPRGSKRRSVMMRLAADVQMRVVAASFVPLAVFLGPLVMTFLWLPLRVDPAVWNSPPGSSGYVMATVDGELVEPIALEVSGPVTLDETTPAVRALLPVRKTLERIAVDLEKGTVPAVLEPLVRKEGDKVLADLKQFLGQPLASREVSWRIRTGDVAGRFPVTLRSQGQSLTTFVVLGDDYPPELGEATGPSGSALRCLKVKYDPPPRKQLFCKPLSWAPIPPAIRHYELGWLGVYLLAYLPAMFGLKWLLRIA